MNANLPFSLPGENCLSSLSVGNGRRGTCWEEDEEKDGERKRFMNSQWELSPYVAVA